MFTGKQKERKVEMGAADQAAGLSPETVNLGVEDFARLAASGEARRTAGLEAEIAVSEARLAALKAERAYRQLIVELAKSHGFDPDVAYVLDHVAHRLVRIGNKESAS